MLVIGFVVSGCKFWQREQCLENRGYVAPINSSVISNILSKQKSLRIANILDSCQTWSVKRSELESLLIFLRERKGQIQCELELSHALLSFHLLFHVDSESGHMCTQIWINDIVVACIAI